MKYNYRSEAIKSGVTLYRVDVEGRSLTHRDVHQLWQEDPNFIRFYVQLMIVAGYSGFCWETPAITVETLDNEHEFVIIKSDAHSTLNQNWTPFSEHFRTSCLAVSFVNLGKNGTMIAPAPDRSFDGGSIASFLNTASDKRIVALWKLVGKEISTHVTSIPVWLSTAGLGVSWLHVRLDTRPKYYRYLPYKNWP